MNNKISLLVLMLALWSPILRAEELTIAVASNFSRAMDALVSHFETSSGHEVKVSYGSSGRLYAQIINGAPFELFFSADQAKPERLEQAGHVVPDTRFTYATGGLVLWSADPDLALTDGESLRTQPINRLAIANPSLAPYGFAAMQVLQSLELEGVYSDKLVMGENINQAFQFVNTGNAQAGFVALAQVSGNGIIERGSGWIIPENLYAPIRQDVVLLKKGAGNQAALDFLEFLGSDEAKSIISRFGYNAD
jgi:molybdenum ABC transporter molybdate-binding protein